MSKTHWLLFITLLCSGLTSFADSSSGHTKNISIGSANWIETKLRQYPELLWLIEDRSASNAYASYSLDLFNKNCPLFDETLVSLIYLHSFLKGTHSCYLSLKQKNPKLVDYTFKDFLIIHKKLKTFFKSFKPEISQDEFIRIVETSVVLKNIYCSEKAKKLFQSYFVSPSTSEEEFYVKSLKVLEVFPELSPSFRRLNKQGQHLVCHARTLMDYRNLLTLSLDRDVFFKNISLYDLNFDLLVFLIDLCGKSNYCISVQNDFISLVKHIQENFNPHTKTLNSIYQAQLQYEGEKYGEKTDSLKNISLIRLAKSLNLKTPEEFLTLKHVLDNLDENIQEQLISYMAQPEKNLPLTGIEELKESVFQVLIKEGYKDQLRTSLRITLSMVARGISYYRKEKAKLPVKHLNFSNKKINRDLLNHYDNLCVSINNCGEIFFSFDNNYSN